MIGFPPQNSARRYESPRFRRQKQTLSFPQMNPIRRARVNQQNNLQFLFLKKRCLLVCRPNSQNRLQRIYFRRENFLRRQISLFLPRNQRLVPSFDQGLLGPNPTISLYLLLKIHHENESYQSISKPFAPVFHFISFRLKCHPTRSCHGRRKWGSAPWCQHPDGEYRCFF